MNEHTFPHETSGLPEATRPDVIELRDGGAFDLDIAPVRKTIGDSTVRMLAYGGSVPGPTLKVSDRKVIEEQLKEFGKIVS